MCGRQFINRRPRISFNVKHRRASKQISGGERRTRAICARVRACGGGGDAAAICVTMLIEFKKWQRLNDEANFEQKKQRQTFALNDQAAFRFFVVCDRRLLLLTRARGRGRRSAQASARVELRARPSLRIPTNHLIGAAAKCAGGVNAKMREKRASGNPVAAVARRSSLAARIEIQRRAVAKKRTRVEGECKSSGGGGRRRLRR